MITLFGHGYIGRAIAAELQRQEIPFNWRHHTDLVADDFVINAAGYIGVPNVDACEDHRAETVSGNIIWSYAVARLGKPTIHISSGCMYRGDKGGNGFSETDVPNFTGSWYSVVKQAEEEILRAFPQYVFRIRMPFGREWHPRNLLTKLQRYPRLVDSTNSLTHVNDLAKAVVFFYVHRPPVGVYNVCNPGAATTREIASMMRLDKDWFGPGECIGRAERSFCVLDVRKLMAVSPLPDVHEALRGCV